MKTIFFDFDGTLADTSRGIVCSYQRAFSALNLQVPDVDFIKRNIGPPLKDTLRILSPDSDEGEIDRLAVEYRKFFSEEGLFQMDFYDDILPILKDLSTVAKLGIVSSKPEPFIVRILEKYSLSDEFTFITGVSLGFVNKPKKERLADLIKNNYLDPTDCIMVGDRAEDCNSASFAGIRFIGVTYGFGTETEFPQGTTLAGNASALDSKLRTWMSE